MAQTKYTYSIADDTANGLLAADALKAEYEASAIVTALDYISALGDVLDIYCKDALSAGDKTILDGVVTAHAGVGLEGDPTPVSLSNVQLDSENAPIQRVKATKSGWHYQPHWMEVKLGEHGQSNGIYNKDKDESDLGFTTYKIYDDQDAEITDAANKLDAVKTVVTWEPDHDYEIIASKIFQKSSPSNDIRVWVEGLPDVPYGSGGSRMFGEGGINLSMLGAGAAADTDGRSSKELSYDATYHTNKFEVTIRHNTGETHSFALLWEIYKL